MYLLYCGALLKDILMVMYSSPPGLSSYLIAKQSRDTGFRGITYGCEVVTPLQGKHQSPACQIHQLPGQVAKACTHRKWQQREGKGREEEWDEGALLFKLWLPFWILFKEKCEKGDLSIDEGRGDCIRERKREHECSVDLLGAKKQAIIWARFNFNKCGFVVRLGHSVWCFFFRRRGVLICIQPYFLFHWILPISPLPAILSKPPISPPSQPIPLILTVLEKLFAGTPMIWYTSQRHKLNTWSACFCISVCVWYIVCWKKTAVINRAIRTYIWLSLCILPEVEHVHLPHQSLKIPVPCLEQTHWQ